MHLIKLISTSLLSIIAISALSQDTIYIDKDKHWLKNKKRANAYLVKTPIDSQNIKVEFYTLGDTLYEVGHYSVFEKNVKDCIRNGRLTKYYPNGQEKLITNYKNNKYDGEYRKFHSNGQLKYICRFVDGKREGDLTMYYDNNTIWRTEKYQDGKCKEGHVYDKDGKEIEFFPSESMPQFPGGVQAIVLFLSTHVKYPQEALRKRLEGRVVVQFVVSKKGYISDPEVVRSAEPILDQEAIRVIRDELSKVQWKPAIQDGELVQVRHTVPVTFKIPSKK